MKKKKLHYLPGIISILCLPVLLFFRGPADPVHQNCIWLNLPSNTADTTGIERFTTAAVYETIKNKKIIALDVNDLTWNEQSEYVFNQKFKFIAHEIESLQFTNDTASVLKISFGTENNFKSFVWVLNQAMVYDLRHYTLIGNDLYLFPNPSVKPRYASFDLHGRSFAIPGLKPPAKWEIFKRDMQYKLNAVKYQFEYLFYKQQQNILLAAGFLLLIVLPGLIKIRKYFMAYKRTYSLS